MCRHVPPCPAAEDPGREAAHTVSCHPEQGWSLLCNGVVLFDDGGEILPSGQTVPSSADRWGRPIPGAQTAAGSA